MKKIYFTVILIFLLLQGCAAVNTFPTLARAGDTISVMVGGSEEARKDNVSVVLIDASGTRWDLQLSGKVKSVFNVRPDGKSEGLYYSSFLDLNTPWAFGHEPMQTVLVLDLPDNAAPGIATLEVSINTQDNSSGQGGLVSVNIEIIPGSGSSNDFAFEHVVTGITPTDFSRIEPLPYLKINFPLGSYGIGAVSLIVDFDENIIPSDDLIIYVPQATVRNQLTNTYDKSQRMVYWRQDGQQLFIDVISPQGIKPEYLNIYVLHPRDISSYPEFTLLSSNLYDVNGNQITVIPVMEYFP